MKTTLIPSLFTALLSVTAISCVSRINVGRVTEPPPSVAVTGQAKEFQLTSQAAGLMAKGGVYYALPRTRIAAEVAVEREIFLPGKLARHAPACLGLAADEIETQPSIKYSIAGGTVATNPEPDPAQVFLIDIRGRYFETKTMTAKYAGGGVLSSVSAESDDQSVAVALEAVKAAAGLASKAASLAAARPPDAPPAAETAADKEKRVQEATCTAYKKLVGQRAALLDELASVQTPTLEKGLQEVDVAINAYRSYYYTGVTTKFAAQRRFHYLPGAAASTPPELVQFSGDGGVCSVENTLLNGPAFPAAVTANGTATYFQDLLASLKLRVNDYQGSDYADAVLQLQKLEATAEFQACSCQRPAGKPDDAAIKAEVAKCANKVRAAAKRDVKLPAGDNWSLPEFKRDNSTDPAPATPLSLNVARLNGLGSVLAEAARAETGQRGLYYRVPAAARISLNRGAREWGATTAEIAQLGAVVSLPNSTGGRKTAYTADFTPAGALQNFSINSTALLDKTLVSTLQSTAESVMGTVETLRTPAPAPDTLAALEKQRKILQERKLIAETERALEQLLRPAGQQ